MKRSQRLFRKEHAAFFALALLMVSQQGFAMSSMDAADRTATGGHDSLSVQDVISMGSGQNESVRTLTDTPLMLEVSVNEEKRPGLFSFVQRGNALLASQETLKQLGIRLGTDRTGLVDLKALPHVVLDYQPAQQTLKIIINLADLHANVTQLMPEGRASGDQRPIPAPSPLGFLLNYDLYGAHSSYSGTTQNFLSGSVELRVFKNQWVASNTELFTFPVGGNTHTSMSASGPANVQRLDTFFQRAFLDSETTLTVGDSLSSSTYPNRPTRMGGIQIKRDFSLNPYAITQPLGVFRGSATLPSDVELYVDGLKQYEGKVPVGPFSLNTLPSVTGSGQANLVLTDILGRQQEVTIPFYNSAVLLAPDLSSWSIEAGKPRQNYGLKSFDYAGPWFASGTWLHGWNQHLTTETHALVSDKLQLAYLGGHILLGRSGGIVSAGAGRSQNGQQSGTQWQLGYEWRSNRFSFSADTIRASSGYRDLPSLLGSDLAIRTDRLNTSIVLDRLGSVGFSYFSLKYAHAPTNRYAGLNWSTNLGSRGYLTASINQNLNTTRDRSFFLSASFNLGKNTNLDTSLSQQSRHGPTSSVSLEHPLAEQQGWGWRARADRTNGESSLAADMIHRNSWSESTGGIQKTADGFNAYAGTRGSLVFMEGHFFLSQQSSQSFSIVSTDGRAGVPVLLENRPYGKTNADGYLLVTDLQPWQYNKIQINALGLPANVQVVTVEEQAVPPRLAGTVTRFKLKEVLSQVFHLVDQHGHDLPVGASVSIGGEHRTSVVGYDGQVYVDNIHGTSVKLASSTADGQPCHVSVSPNQPNRTWVCAPTTEQRIPSP